MTIGWATGRQNDSEDDSNARTEQMLKMEKVLEVIWANSEDLEAHSRRNNIQILGLIESTVMGKIESFVEDLLRSIFGNHLTSLFSVELAHISLGPCPLLGL